MKKFFAIILAGLLVLGGTGVAFASTVTLASPSATQTEQTAVLDEQHNLYLVPGTYVASGAKVENSISSGATKLTAEQCEEIFTDNAYLCTLAEGATLPTPTSSRVDKNGNAYSFNGWWAIVDASVAYFDKVPAINQTTFLYADWRADLSQRKDPVIPDENPTITAVHYMTIKRAATGETETFVLRVGGTDVAADSLGYGSPVQLYNGWFELSKDDVITVYTNGLGSGSDKDKVQVAPILNSSGKSTINLESAGDGSNVTADYLTYKGTSSKRTNPTLTCIAQTSRHYRIYIKFYSGGSTMAVYMEPMD